MNEQELRQLITEIVTGILNGHDAPAPPSGPTALVLFSGALLGFEAALDSLARLKGTVRCDWTQTPAATRILDQDAIAAVGMTPAAKSLVRSHDLLVVPTATVNLVAKVAHGIGDCLASNVMAEFIMMNKPVVLATNAACPDSADKRGWFPDMPEGYQRMLRRNLAELKDFGVRLTTAERLDEAVASAAAGLQGGDVPGVRDAEGAGPSGRAGAVDCHERLIHEGLIRSLVPGSVVRIGRKAIVTPLARDAAAEAGITMERN